MGVRLAPGPLQLVLQVLRGIDNMYKLVIFSKSGNFYEMDIAEGRTYKQALADRDSFFEKLITSGEEILSYSNAKDGDDAESNDYVDDNSHNFIIRVSEIEAMSVYKYADPEE